MADAAVVLGMLLILTGIGIWSPPLAVLTAGVALVVAGILITLGDEDLQR